MKTTNKSQKKMEKLEVVETIDKEILEKFNKKKLSWKSMTRI